jgi:hypothetical protein
MSSETSARSTRPAIPRPVQDLLREAGLGEQVRIGLPLAMRTPSSVQPYVPPGAEEGFSPDALLCPLVRPQQGALIELVGPLSSGRTALACRMAAGATLRGEWVGWVDWPGALDPRSLARSGAELSSVLWVRPTRLQAALRSAELLLKAGLALVVLDLERSPRPLGAAHDELHRLGTSTSVWMRLARAARGARSTLLVIAPQRLAGTQAALGLETERRGARFESGLFEGLEASLHVTRSRQLRPFHSLSFQLHHRPARAS